ncbi:MAG: sugar isomerase [Bacteroidetes bacterium]|nr:MAG: sugar isomerase [Bacteroidota bacterium]
MKYFDLTEAEMARLGAIHTAREIWNQPQVWDCTYKKFIDQKDEIESFRNKVLKQCNKIILTGAGTSAYIGYSLEGTFQRYTGITTISIPTTHLVTHPGDYLNKCLSTLVISFARSGNSPESVAALRLVDKMCKNVFHLVITCDEEGKLARYQSPNPKYTIVLPPESNDKSLAMTSSYTSMTLTGLLFARIKKDNDALARQVQHLRRFGKTLIHEKAGLLKDISKLRFNRAVFMGSGPLFGTSTESSLKLQELTDGNIVCKSDSYLGFRHGPKAVIDEQTIVLFLFSNKQSVQRYEKDFVRDMQKGKNPMRLIGVSESPVADIELDTEICFSTSPTGIDEDFLSIAAVLPAQILGMFKSIELELKPDNPSVTGAISRVVEGVVIYDEETSNQ